MAMARSGGGALGRRQAAFNTANLQQDAARQSAMVRMAEQLQANQQLGNVLEQGRTSDITLATNQGNLNQNANLANQTAFNTALAQQAQLNQNATLANQSAFNSRNLAQANINQALASSRAAAGAQVRAASIGAGAANAATNAGLYKFNQQLQFDMDRYYQGQGRSDVDSNYNISQNRNNDLIASQGRGNAALNNAGGNMANAANLPSSWGGFGGDQPLSNANQQSQDAWNAGAMRYRGM
jgi:hypothetical protein